MQNPTTKEITYTGPFNERVKRYLAAYLAWVRSTVNHGRADATPSLPAWLATLPYSCNR